MKHLAVVLISLASWILAPIIVAMPFIIHKFSVVSIFNPSYYRGSFVYCVCLLWPLFIHAANLSNIYVNNKTRKIAALIFIYFLQIITKYIMLSSLTYIAVALFMTFTFLYGASYILIDKIIRDKTIDKYKIKPSIAKKVVVVIYLIAATFFIYLINNPW